MPPKSPFKAFGNYNEDIYELYEDLSHKLKIPKDKGDPIVFKYGKEIPLEKVKPPTNPKWEYGIQNDYMQNKIRLDHIRLKNPL